MRILMAGQTFAPARNGQAVFSANLAAGLARRGHAVLVVTTARGRRGGRTSRDGYRVHRLAAISGSWVHPDVFLVPFPGRALRRVFDEFEPEHVHLQDHYPLARAVARIAAQRGLPRLGTNHFLPDNVLPYLPLPRRLRPRLEPLLWRTLRSLYDGLDVVTVPSETARAILRAQGMPAALYTVSCGVDLARFHPGAEPERGALRTRFGLDPARSLFLYVGRLDAEKRLDLLVDALQRLGRSDVQLAIVGHGADASRLRARIAQRDLGRAVVLTGAVSDADLPRLLCSADVFAIASGAELQSIATLEAMACGRPVLAAAARALPELVREGENGRLFRPGDAGDAARAMATLLAERARWPELGAASLVAARRHGIERTVDRYLELYEESRSRAASRLGQPRAASPAALSGAPAPRTILFAPASNILFHVGRSVRLARELAAHGHRIVFAGTPRYLRDPAVVAPGEFELEPLPDFDAEYAMELVRSIRLRPDRRFVAELVAAERSLLERLRPDLVVADFRPSIGLAARACGVPLVSLLLSHWMQPYAARRLPAARTDAASAWITGWVGPRITARFTPSILRLVTRSKMGPFRAVARALGQPPPRYLWDALRGDLNLLADTESWCPTRALPPDFRKVGPILWEPELPLPAWASRLDRSRPVIYANFGSTGHPNLFRRVFEELGALPCQVMLTTCGQIDPARFTVPDNFVVERFLPVSAAMQIADLVVYHGGAGTAYQAILAGVPVVVVATHWDQEYQGLAVEEHGLGRFLALREVVAQPGLLAETTQQVLKDLYMHRERAKVLREDLLRYDGPAAAAACIEELLQQGAGRRARAGGPD